MELPPCNLLLPRTSWSLHFPRSRIQLQHYLDSVTAPLPWLFHVGKITTKKWTQQTTAARESSACKKKKQRRVLREIQAYSQLVHIISVHRFLKNEKKMILRAKLREEFSRQKMKFCKRKNTIFGKAEQTTFHFSLQHRGRPLYLTPL